MTELAAQLRAALGVAVTTTELTYAQYVRASADRHFCLLYALTSPVFDHPAGSLSFWRSTGRAARQSAFVDERFDELLDLAEACEDPAEAERRWRAAEERWWWTVPKIPLVQVYAWFLCSPDLVGDRIDADGLLRFERLLDRSPSPGRGPLIHARPAWSRFLSLIPVPETQCIERHPPKCVWPGRCAGGGPRGWWPCRGR
ncbi:hypothetical protein [Streptomyces sp. NPDC056160]|uniref:hypothetical protein n=1 Tax=Streptomyces sp. NPDC056160 TaxID=3345731 RepID=UPI0035D8D666